MAMDDAGNFVVTWTSDGQDGSGYGVYAQRYDVSGASLGTEFRVNTTTTNWQMESSVAMSDAGEFLISWSSAGQDGDGFGIYAQLYSVSGVPVGGEFRINTTTTGNQRYSTVASDADGNFVVTWTSTGQDGGGDGIYARLYNSSGTPQGGEFRVNTFATGDQRYSAVAMDSDGDFVVTWKSELQDGDGFGIYAQRYSATGVAQGGEFLVNSFVTGNQIDPSVAIDDGGNFVITWTSWFQDSSENGIYARRFSSSGAVQGSEFRVNTETLSNQEYSTAAMDSDGDFVISWLSRGQDPGGSAGIYAQRYSPDGNPQGDEFRVNLSTALDQINPVVAMDASGNFVVVWESPDADQLGVYGQRFLTNGPVTLNGLTLKIDGTANADTISVTSVAGENPSLNVLVNGSVFPFAPARVNEIIINGFGGNDTLTVDSNVALPTTIDGGTGDDTLTGGAGNDHLTGGEGHDTLAGHFGDDTYLFNAASTPESDSISEVANEGVDTLTFSLVSSPVNLNLETSVVQSVHLNRTVKLNAANTFENAVGGSGADTLTGNALNNVLTGGPGDDKLNGAGGNDSLIGGSNNDTYLFRLPVLPEADQVTESPNDGTDTLSFSLLPENVALKLGSTSIQSVHTNRTLKLNSGSTIENAVGGSGADTLIGNSLNNTLYGLAGNDKLTGAGGSDVMFGGPNDDTYLFAAASSAEADQAHEKSNEGLDTLNFSTMTMSVIASLGTSNVQNVHTNRTLKLNTSSTFEHLTGGSDGDTLTGNALNNTLIGGAGHDSLYGAAGSDILFGGLNDDTYNFATATSAEFDQVHEKANEGTDTLNFATMTVGVVASLGTSNVQNVHTNRTLKLNTSTTFENLTGGNGADTLTGNTIANRLIGGNGNNILVGLDGSDTLEAGTGRDILIGGLGLDTLNGGSGDDILIAGRTTNDTNAVNLNTLRTEWISASAHATRIANLRAGVGSPLASLKAKVNVLNDAGEDDSLTGGANLDWYFQAVDDAITDLFAGEIIDVL
jgi:Ca2+-binding RTX toxin-like protein